MSNLFFERGLNGCELQLSNTLRRLWFEHVLWTRFFIVSTAFNLPDLQCVTARLLQNPSDFAKVLEKFYGECKAKEFKRLLTEHLLIAAALVNALKARNIIEVEKQRKKWYDNAVEIAEFLACINPFWSKRQWKELLFDHLRMTEDEAVFTLRGEYKKSIKIFDEIEAQALKMADVMTQGILRQFKI